MDCIIFGSLIKLNNFFSSCHYLGPNRRRLVLRDVNRDELDEIRKVRIFEFFIAKKVEISGNQTSRRQKLSTWRFKRYRSF